jgi:hypothetical protein
LRVGEYFGTRCRHRPDFLAVDGLQVHFPIRKGFLQRTVGHVRAVDGVSLAISAGGRWPWRRIRLRQDDGGQGLVAADRAERRVGSPG